MVIIAVMCSLVMRTPNPKRTGLDFVMGMLFALPLGALYFLLILLATQQNLPLLFVSLIGLTFVLGWEGQKRRIGVMGALIGTLNLLVLSSPMSYNFIAFIDGALGQLIGSGIAYLVILLVRDNSQLNTRRALVDSLLKAVLLQLRCQDKKSNQLPVLYAYYNRLLQLAPADERTLRLALNLIVYYHVLISEKTSVGEASLAEYKSMLYEFESMTLSSSKKSKRKHYIGLLSQLRRLNVAIRNEGEGPATLSALTKDLSCYRRHY